MNRDLIRQQIRGSGSFIVRTSDDKEFDVLHPEFVMVGRHNLIIENAKGVMDIIDPMHVVSIRPGGKRRTKAA
jgi:hypothetical protein